MNPEPAPTINQIMAAIMVAIILGFGAIHCAAGKPEKPCRSMFCGQN